MNDKNPLILIVDDTTTNIDLLLDVLKGQYRFGVAKSGPRALSFVQKKRPDLILLDVMMPDMDGFEVCSRLKSDPALADIAIIFITALTESKYILKGFEMGAVDYITKPFKATEVRARVQTHISLQRMQTALNRQNIHLEEQVREKTALIREMFNATVSAMSLMAESLDPYTAGHQQRVSQYACAIAKQMELPSDKIEAIRIAGLLHDIGKVRVPVSILNRPGPLLKAEANLIRIHPYFGYNFLKKIPSPWPIADIVYQHHERLDGRGYPQGLTGKQILLESKIMAVADVIEAISSHRPYRPAHEMEYAINEIVSHKGDSFDPDVVNAFLECSDKYEQEEIISNPAPLSGPFANPLITEES
ncbi:MAG: response regulator [Deltaproteobacteria bacterium]|nr:response regulator [Deltaproteobacteria bacterium]